MAELPAASYTNCFEADGSYSYFRLALTGPHKPIASESEMSTIFNSVTADLRIFPDLAARARELSGT
jgi:hypothetical protein